MLLAIIQIEMKRRNFIKQGSLILTGLLVVPNLVVAGKKQENTFK